MSDIASDMTVAHYETEDDTIYLSYLRGRQIVAKNRTTRSDSLYAYFPRLTGLTASRNQNAVCPVCKGALE